MAMKLLWASRWIYQSKICKYSSNWTNLWIVISIILFLWNRLAQSVKLSIAIAIFFTYALQFYVPVEIIWKSVGGYFSEGKKNIGEYALRAILVSFTVAIAIGIPNIGPFISLIGAAGLSTLGLMFPPIIEIITYYKQPGYGKFMWILWKNVFLILCGIASFFTGTYVSLLEIYNDVKWNEKQTNWRASNSFVFITNKQTTTTILRKWIMWKLLNCVK